MPPFYFLTFAKSRHQSRKHLVLKKSLGIGLGNIWSRKKVSVSVSKKSLGIGLDNVWSRKKVSVSVSKILVWKKSLGIGLKEIFWSRHSVVGTWQGTINCGTSSQADFNLNYFLSNFFSKFLNFPKFSSNYHKFPLKFFSSS